MHFPNSKKNNSFNVEVFIQRQQTGLNFCIGVGEGFSSNKIMATKKLMAITNQKCYLMTWHKKRKLTWKK